MKWVKYLSNPQNDTLSHAEESTYQSLVEKINCAMQETTFSLAFQMVGLSSKSINTTVNINFNKPLYLSKN